jgi:DNA-binding LytR/AlgR family response regulator
MKKTLATTGIREGLKSFYQNLIFENLIIITCHHRLIAMTSQPFFYREDGILKRINLEEIYFLEVTDNYVRFFALNYHIMIRASLDGVLANVPKDMFIRIHRSYAVSPKYLDTIEKDHVTFVSVPDATNPIGRKYYADLISRLKIVNAEPGDTGE